MEMAGAQGFVAGLLTRLEVELDPAVFAGRQLVAVVDGPDLARQARQPDQPSAGRAAVNAASPRTRLGGPGGPAPPPVRDVRDRPVGDVAPAADFLVRCAGGQEILDLVDQDGIEHGGLAGERWPRA